MPDVFVPMDTTKLTEYYVTLRNKGVVNDFSLRWVERHRKSMQPIGFNQFLKIYDSYNADADLAAYAKSKGYEPKEDNDADPVRVATTERYQHLILKALIARNLYGSHYYYQVMKDFDECYKKALEQF